ncbi:MULTISPECIES: PAS domain-containing sensor histidine kinase [unclassified Methylobacterium]|uniref:PAS domain-containing sensor histidine kinase n=1 Tax=unclassified Methylobacterium TaxID=2615210 RepID=UPI0006F6FB57|nr:MULTISPECIES: ATP-binding protein [unclassified Methylobacterium]KQP51593.1 PAS domain-containing sensor histidine kinase [Methylobacterium sp. Leaf106]TXN25442.1 PAS domain S-box protein [Methylobacterium sp. WL19]
MDAPVVAAPSPPRSGIGPDTRRTGRLLGVLALGLALAIFLVDAFTPLEGAVAVLYVVVVLVSARAFRRNGVILTASGCLLLTAVAYFLSHRFFDSDSALLRALVSLAAIAISALLVLRNQAAARILAEQAELLELTHDPIFVRTPTDTVTFWNRAAEDLYGWRRDEVRGRNVHVLLRTAFPGGEAAIRDALMRNGRWEGELVQTVRSGARVVVESRWSLQRDAGGQPLAVLETNTDITERKRAHAALAESERRYRTIFDTARVAILQQDWREVKAVLDAVPPDAATPLRAYLHAHPEVVRDLRRSVTIVDANAELRRLIGADAGAAAPRSLDALLFEDEPTFIEALLALARGETFFEGETTIRALSGDPVPILFGITFPSHADGFEGVLVFAVDITERKQAQEALLAVQAELAHTARVTTLGELTASIAHEVNQPLAAIVTNGEAALRWLRRSPPDLGEVSAAVTRVVASGSRAGEIVSRIRTFLAKTPPPRDWLDLREMIGESVLLVEREMVRGGVRLIRDVASDVTLVHGDRVQLQQVLINLMVNAIQAMATVTERPRLLTIRVAPDGAEHVRVTVADSGGGIAAEAVERVFQPFFTTKADGMGMGLAICRSIVEAHGGRLWITGHDDPGAAFHFTIPTTAEREP